MLLTVIPPSQVILSDIENHQPTVDSINTMARPLIQSSEPKEARQLQAKLDSINDRYGKVTTRTGDHGNHLQMLSSKLSDFEDEVEQLEDRLLPSVDELESKQIAQQTLPEFSSRLQVSTQWNIILTCSELSLVFCIALGCQSQQHCTV